MNNKEKLLRKEIDKRIKKIFELRKKNKIFIPGETRIQYGGGVFDDKEISAAVNSLIDGWFGLGKKGIEFEQVLARYIGAKGSILTNSGSSANLLSIAALMSPLYPDRLKPGDEVITSACGFPATVNPLVFYGLVPVFLDINKEMYNIEAQDLEKALSKKTRAVVVAHTLGNPNEMDKIINFCKKNNLLLIEDNCDSLGSEYDGKKTGSFGAMATQSFYPPHHITTGEGGAVLFQDLRFEKIVRSLRDWGRSCWCRGDEKSVMGACGVRFKYTINGQPYDHRYIFNQIGYNLKPIEAQAAMGLEQLKRLPFFVKKRKENFNKLYGYMKIWEKFFILPKWLPKSKPSWFTFPLTIRNDAGFTRHELIMFLEKRMIQTRPLFAGNIIRQPAYNGVKYRKIGSLKNADFTLHNTFFLGVYPDLGEAEIAFMAESIGDFVKSKFK